MVSPVPTLCPALRSGRVPPIMTVGSLFGRHEDMGAHGGRRRLAVGSGNAQGVFIALHDSAPCLGALKHGMPISCARTISGFSSCAAAVRTTKSMSLVIFAASWPMDMTIPFSRRCEVRSLSAISEPLIISPHRKAPRPEATWKRRLCQ